MSLRLRPGADEALRDIVNQLNQRFALAEYPQRPTRLYRVATPDDLPPAEDWPDCEAAVSDIDGAGTYGVAVSTGAAWVRGDDFSVTL